MKVRKLIIVLLTIIGVNMAAISNTMKGLYPGNINRNTVTQSDPIMIGVGAINQESPLDEASTKLFDDYTLQGRIQPPTVKGVTPKNIQGFRKMSATQQRMQNKRAISNAEIQAIKRAAERRNIAPAITENKAPVPTAASRASDAKEDLNWSE